MSEADPSDISEWLESMREVGPVVVLLRQLAEIQKLKKEIIPAEIRGLNRGVEIAENNAHIYESTDDGQRVIRVSWGETHMELERVIREIEEAIRA